MTEKKVYICSSCEKETDRTILGQCEKCFKNKVDSRDLGCYPEAGLTKAQILIEIHELRGDNAHDMKQYLMRVGQASIDGKRDDISIQSYYEAKAKVSVLDDLLEKIAKTPGDTGNPKSNPFCNDIIRDAEGNEIARARG